MFALLTLSTVPAMAQADPSPYWGLEFGHTVGHNCDKIPADVGFLQSVLWASHQLDGVGEVDKVWGPRTRTATETWQRGHSLVADGCAGYATWSRIAYGFHNMGSRGRVYHYTQGPWSGPSKDPVRLDSWSEPGGTRTIQIRYGQFYAYRAVSPRNGEQFRRSNS